MKKLGLLILVPCLLAVGCASHYTRPNDGNIDFYLRCPDGHEVSLATSQDGFAPHPARPAGADLWVVSVKATRDFSYFYLVDGKILIPACRMIEQDDFGGINCIYSTLP